MKMRMGSSLGVLVAGLAICFSQVAGAQSHPSPGTSQPLPGIIADNDSIYVDAAAFQVTHGKARYDSSMVKPLGARELGQGAIIFRSGGKLFIVESPLLLPEGISSDGRRVVVDGQKNLPNRLRIEYIPPKNPEHQSIYDLVKERGALETVQKLFSPFRLPADLTVMTIGCDGVANAWYEMKDGRPTVNICYEYLASLVKYAPKETTPAGVTHSDAIVGQLLFVVAHEMGHALFELLEIPVFGREEDAADQFAAYFILRLGNERAPALIGGAAYAYQGFMKDFAENPKIAVPLETFSSTHGAPEERFYNLLCTAYGSDPDRFGYVVENKYLPKTRSGNCRYEYKVLTKAVRSQILPHIDRQLASQVWDVPQTSGSRALVKPTEAAAAVTK
jgi:hypothetical protein